MVSTSTSHRLSLIVTLYGVARRCAGRRCTAPRPFCPPHTACRDKEASIVSVYCSPVRQWLSLYRRQSSAAMSRRDFSACITSQGRGASTAMWFVAISRRSPANQSLPTQGCVDPGDQLTHMTRCSRTAAGLRDKLFESFRPHVLQFPPEARYEKQHPYFHHTS